MVDRSTATAAPTPIKVGDQTFLMSPMTDEDHGIMDQWIRSRHVRIARETLPENAPDDQKDRTERIALAQASTMSFMSGAGLLLMEQPEPMSMLFWCCIRHNHPDVTPETIRGLFADPKNYNALLAEWNRIHNELTPKLKKDEKKKKNKRKTARKSKRRNQ